MFMKIVATILAAALFAIAAPSQAQLLPGTSQLRSFNFEGRLRSYRVLVPPSAVASSPILVGLHGGMLGTAQQFEQGTGLSALATQYGFVTVYPQGVNSTWNAGECCGVARTMNVNDVGFIEAAIADVRTRHGLSGGAVYATGISNGGMMAYRLGCERPNLFAGIAPVAATLTLPACAPTTPVSVLHIHGLKDQYVPYDGGLPSKGFARGTFRMAVPDAIHTWTVANHCSGPHPQTARSLRAGQFETSGNGCQREVRLLTLEDAGHAWPGDDGAVSSLVVDPSYTAYDAAARIIDFFGLSN